MNRALPLIFASTCLFPALAQAQSPGSPPTPPPPSIDRIAVISVESMRSSLETRFNRVDTNGDGSLSKEEYLFLSRYPKLNQTRAEQDEESESEEREQGGPLPYIRLLLTTAQLEFDILDTDKDETISAAERKAYIDILSTLDSNDDGNIEPDELRDMFKSLNAVNKERQ